MDINSLELQIRQIEQMWRTPFVPPVIDEARGLSELALVDLRKQEHRDHWKALHTCEDPTEEWYQNWIGTVPGSGCGSCQAKLLELIERLQLRPRFNEWFSFTNDLHNAVNASIDSAGSHPQFSLQDALRRWRPMPQRRARFASCKIVTSFGPKRIERQKWVLRSWLRSGFEVVALQCPDEIASVASTFGGDGVSILKSEPTEGYEFATPRINCILNAVTDSAFMILNSDCAIVDPWPIYADVAAGSPRAYLRWNYDADSEALASEFEWGLDGFLLWPSDARLFPESPLGLGQPVWDYALPHCLNVAGRKVTINHNVVVAHENHKQAWSQEAWERGRAWMATLWPDAVIGDPEFRKALDPEYFYDAKAGKWVARLGT